MFSTNTIIVTCRSRWNEMSSKIAKSITEDNQTNYNKTNNQNKATTEDNQFKNLQAIIVVDDNIGCVDYQLPNAEKQNCYRPSLPYPLV